MRVNRFVGSTSSCEKRYNTSKSDFKNSSIKTVSSIQRNILNDTNHSMLGPNTSIKSDYLTEDCSMHETRSQVLNSK